jgi:predicted RNA-binding Zn-ribbon protein involved in translation (DUF1610 family)
MEYAATATRAAELHHGTVWKCWNCPRTVITGRAGRGTSLVLRCKSCGAHNQVATSEDGQPIVWENATYGRELPG